MNGNGADWDGYTPAVSRDRQPVDGKFAGLWPKGTEGVAASDGPGHDAEPTATLVYLGEDQGKPNRQPRPAPGGGT